MRDIYSIVIIKIKCFVTILFQGSPPDDENSESAKEKADRIMQKIKANGNLSPSDPAVNEENRTIETDEGSDINVLQVTENNLFTVQVGQEVESKSYTITTSDTQNSDDIEFEFNSGLAEADQQALQQLEIEQQKHFLDGDNKEQVNITVNSDETISNGSIVSNNIGKGMVSCELLFVYHFYNCSILTLKMIQHGQASKLVCHLI